MRWSYPTESGRPARWSNTPTQWLCCPSISRAAALLVRQYRYPIGKDLLEAPAGGIDSGESPEQAAQRELQEEIGYIAGSLERLGAFWTAPGFCTEYMYAYLARDLTPSSLAPDEDEEIVVERHSLDSVREMIRDGRIVDAKTIAAFWMALDRLG